MVKTRKLRPLTVKQKKFVANKIKGLNNTTAYIEAGYNVSTDVARANASRMLTKANVSEAIDLALTKLEATPEYAVSRVKDVAELEVTDRSAPSILKASTTILELHGWRKEERPTTQLKITNAFFSSTKPKADYIQSE